MELPTVACILTEQLRNDILTGKMAPGSKINEIQLAKSLDVSRSPIREVLRVLENERLVENLPRKGTFVTDISLKDFMEVYEIRELIECRSIDVFRKKSVTYIPLVEETLSDEGKIDFPPSDASDFEILDHLRDSFQFHVNMVRSAGNARLVAIFQGIQNNILRYHFQKLTIESEPKSTHGVIVDSIKSKNYNKAKKILRAHIKDHIDKIIAAFSR